MRAQRIKTGFHRIGIVLVAVCVLYAAIRLYENEPLHEAGGTLIIGATLYVLAYALGWIVSGFAGDADKNSKLRTTNAHYVLI